MPWFSVSTAFSFEMPGVMSGIENTIIAGYSTVPGIAILIIAVLIFGLVLIPVKDEENSSRIFTAQVFLSAVIGALFLMGGVVPAFSGLVDYPHIGLLSILAGCIVVFIALKQLHTEMKQ